MMGTAKQAAAAMKVAGVDAKRVFLSARPERFSQGCATRPHRAPRSSFPIASADGRILIFTQRAYAARYVFVTFRELRRR
jgi:hypothetical protein